MESEHGWEADATRLDFDEHVNVDDGGEVRDLAVDKATEDDVEMSSSCTFSCPDVGVPSCAAPLDTRLTRQKLSGTMSARPLLLWGAYSGPNIRPLCFGHSWLFCAPIVGRLDECASRKVQKVFSPRARRLRVTRIAYAGALPRAGRGVCSGIRFCLAMSMPAWAFHLTPEAMLRHLAPWSCWRLADQI